MGKKLTDQQERFALEFLKDSIGSRAAIRAGYSEKSAARRAHELRNNPLVAARIAELQEDLSIRMEIDLDETMQAIRRNAHLDPGGAYDPETGELLPINDIPVHIRMCITDYEEVVTHTKDGERHVKRKARFAPQQKALEMLGRHLGAFKDVQEHKVSMEVADRIRRARSRVRDVPATPPPE